MWSEEKIDKMSETTVSRTATVCSLVENIWICIFYDIKIFLLEIEIYSKIIDVLGKGLFYN